jgi:hypothetical protein
VSIPRCVSTDFATRGARADHLLSKLIAGGLSAGVVLLWWPRFFPHDSAGIWVARGIAWTLLAEILVVALSPLEHVLRARVAAIGPVGHLRSFFSRSSRLRAWFALGLAATAVSVPMMLIATGGRPAKADAPKPQVTNVTKVVKVVKRVQVKHIVVRQPAPAAPQAYPPAVSTPPATPVQRTPASTASPKRASKKPAQRGISKPETPTPTPTAPTPTPGATTVPATPTPAPGA